VFGLCIADVTHPQDEVSRPDDPSSGKQISKYWILVVVIVVVGVLCLAGHALVASVAPQAKEGGTSTVCTVI